MPDWQSAATLVRKIAENYKLPYYTLSPIYSVCKSHGYLAGEKFSCPHCGEKTEVYSRITGYYRPVQNWNDGKAQEYRERKLYDISASMAKRDFAAAPAEAQKADACACESASADQTYVLFATKKCPNCKMAEKFLTDAGWRFEKVYAEDAPEMATSLGIKQAPTLVVMNGDVATEKIVNVSNIRKFIEQR